jgi:hypothetical protein
MKKSFSTTKDVLKPKAFGFLYIFSVLSASSAEKNKALARSSQT